MGEPGIPRPEDVGNERLACRNLGSEHRKGQGEHFAHTFDAGHELPANSFTAIPTWDTVYAEKHSWCIGICTQMLEADYRLG